VVGSIVITENRSVLACFASGKTIAVKMKSAFQADIHFEDRYNQQYRICFEWREDGVYNVEIVDYH
jgi:hypothetical protein